jgi:hypothetical protein
MAERKTVQCNQSEGKCGFKWYSPKGIFFCLLPVIMSGIISCYIPPSGTPISDPLKSQRVEELKPKPAVAPLYFYPKKNQTAEQQDRDRYECYNWAAQQTGFDPNLSVPPQRRTTIVPSAPPGHDAAVLGLTGAAVGAIAAGPRNAPVGAIIGLIAGAAAGSVSDAARQDRAEQLNEDYSMRERMRQTDIENQGQAFRRAMSACLEGRGYTVQ